MSGNTIINDLMASGFSLRNSKEMLDDLGEEKCREIIAGRKKLEALPPEEQERIKEETKALSEKINMLVIITMQVAPSINDMMQISILTEEICKQTGWDIFFLSKMIQAQRKKFTSAMISEGVSFYGKHHRDFIPKHLEEKNKDNGIKLKAEERSTMKIGDILKARENKK